MKTFRFTVSEHIDEKKIDVRANTEAEAAEKWMDEGDNAGIVVNEGEYGYRDIIGSKNITPQ